MRWTEAGFGPRVGLEKLLVISMTGPLGHLGRYPAWKEPMNQRDQQNLRKLGVCQFSIGFLLCAVLISSLLCGWWIDRRRLMEQIPPDPQLTTRTYELKNGSSTKIAETLSGLLGQPGTIQAYQPKQSIIVTATQQTHDQIRIMLNHLDRVGTEYVADSTRPQATTKFTGCSVPRFGITMRWTEAGWAVALGFDPPRRIGNFR